MKDLLKISFFLVLFAMLLACQSVDKKITQSETSQDLQRTVANASEAPVLLQIRPINVSYANIKLSNTGAQLNLDLAQQNVGVKTNIAYIQCYYGYKSAAGNRKRYSVLIPEAELNNVLYASDEKKTCKEELYEISRNFSPGKSLIISITNDKAELSLGN